MQALGFGTTVALPATTLRVVYATVSSSPEWCVRALAPRRAAQRRWLVSCAGYESCAEDSAEPVPRARPTTLNASGGAQCCLNTSFFGAIPPRSWRRGLRFSSVSDPSAGAGLPDSQTAPGQSGLQPTRARGCLDSEEA